MTSPSVDPRVQAELTQSKLLELEKLSLTSAMDAAESPERIAAASVRDVLAPLSGTLYVGRTRSDRLRVSVRGSLEEIRVDWSRRVLALTVTNQVQ